MISSGLEAILVKVAAIGLNKKHLGMTLSEVRECKIIQSHESNQ